MRAFNAAIQEALFPALEDIAAPEESDRFLKSERLDGEVPPFIQRRLETLELRIGAIFDADKLGEALDVVGQRISTKSGNELRRVAGIDIRTADRAVGALIDKFRSDNVARIKSLAGNQLVEITQILKAAETPNLRVEVIRDEIIKRFNVSKSKAALLARDQAITLNANVAQQRQLNLGVEEYTWTTSGDGRVREEHAERDGQVFRWDAPPSDGHPGEPIQCRCSAFPIFPPAL